MDISARITDLENQLTAKSEDIQETKDELAGAKEREAQQYADMKVRIQFMYENGQTSYLEALLSSRNISEFLNSADISHRYRAMTDKSLPSTRTPWSRL